MPPVVSSELPIIQAPMAGGPSTPALTAAVAGAGGYGFLAAGYLSPDDLRDLISATRSITGTPFGVNLFCPSTPADLGPVRAYGQVLQSESDRLGVALGEPRWEDDAYDAKVEIVEAARVDLVSFTFGCPAPATIDRLHGADCRVAVTVTSPEEARAAERAGADLLLVQGTEAGGHQGSFLDLGPNVRPLLSLVDEVRASARVPIVACGGIMTGIDAVAAMRQGAVGVQLGTAFLCSTEAGTSATYRRALLDGTYPGTVLTRAFSGRYARGLANEFALRYGASAPEPTPRSITSPGPFGLRRPVPVIRPPRICGPDKVGGASTPNRPGGSSGRSPSRWRPHADLWRSAGPPAPRHRRDRVPCRRTPRPIAS